MFIKELLSSIVISFGLYLQMATENVYNPGKEDLTFLNYADDNEETASHCIHIYQPSEPEETQSEMRTTRHNILDFGDEGFLLKRLMSEKECKHYIQEGERVGFKSIHGSKKEYRNSGRIMVQSQELADIIWGRIKIYLSNITISDDPHKQHIHGPSTLLKGTWTPLRLNPVIHLSIWKNIISFHVD